MVLPSPTSSGDQNARAHRLQQLDDWLELVGIEVGVGGLEAIDEVGEFARESDVRQRPIQIGWTGEATSGERSTGESPSAATGSI